MADSFPFPTWEIRPPSKPAPKIVGPDEIYLGDRVGDDKGGDGKNGDPVCLARRLLKEGHVHVRGRTRSGKGTLILAPMATKLMEPYELSWKDASGAEHRAMERDAIFFFDLGGDLALFNAVRVAANDRGRKFRYFALDPRKSYYFDPFQSVTADEFRAVRICTLLVEAFHLDHGLMYGGAYFTQRAVSALLRVAERAIQSRRAGRTTGLQDIADYLDRHRERDEDAIRLTLQALLRYENLMPTVQDPNVIDMARAIKEREVIYFFVPTIGESTTARQIAGLGLYTTLNAAMKLASERPLQERAKPLPHCFLFCDEVQEIAGRSFASLLAQTAKHGVSIIMANQTTEQLNTRDLDLADVVRDNTLAKVYFTVTGKRDIEELQTFSREDRDLLRSESISGGQYLERGLISPERRGFSEYVVPMLRKDTILDTSATFGQAFVIVDDGRGHREPARIQARLTLPYEKYLELRHTPLDEVCHPVPPTVAPVRQELLWQRARRLPPDAERQRRLASLTTLLSEKESAERLF
ncbi:MAG: type IV secretory system conjugative DNA transfer family protein [Planctomycetes bacterium]|nr:type IV secretory system conjugative DNA transfer family protein [Planctomycetota bacterium]